mgnify:CR=1 FL=1
MKFMIVIYFWVKELKKEQQQQSDKTDENQNRKFSVSENGLRIAAQKGQDMNNDRANVNEDLRLSVISFERSALDDKFLRISTPDCCQVS